MARQLVRKIQPLVCLGEALFDCFADGRKLLGGAPLNVAIMLRQLGFPVQLISAVGNDSLGSLLLSQLKQWDVGTDFIATSGMPTGKVEVEIHDSEPKYQISNPAAWDHIPWQDTFLKLAKTTEAVCFGTLAQRSETSRRTIRHILRESSQAWRLFDVNLRQTYWDRKSLQAGINLSDATKLNIEELPQVMETLFLKEMGDPIEDAHTLHRETSRPIFITRGAQGTAAWIEGEWFEGKVCTCKQEELADSVGAGDACSAAIIYGKLMGWNWKQILDFANRLGAYVAAKPGATPPLDWNFLIAN